MYDQYGSSRKTTPSKPSNANQQAAASMGSVGIGGIGGRTTTSAAQSIQDKFRRETQRDSGSTYDEVPQTIKTGLGGTRRVPKKPDEEKSTYEKVKETVVGLFDFFGGDEPKDVKTKSGNVYTGPMFAGYTPDTSNFRDLYTEKVPLPKIFEDAGMRLTRSLNDVSPVLPSIDNPALNMFGVTRDFARDPDPLIESPTMAQPETPTALTGVPRALAMASVNTPTKDYVIQAGDTLSEIAEREGTTVKALADLNDIPESDVDIIMAGETLKLPKDPVKDIRVSTRGDENTSTSLRPRVRPNSSELPKDEYYTPYDMSDLEILARTIEAEAGGESNKGKLAVGATIKNRVDKQSWMGKDIKSVILKPGQYSPWNSYTNYAGGEQGKAMLTASKKPSKDSYEAAEKILSGDYKDPTGGATHFVNPKVGTKPSWYNKLKDYGIEKIGKHEFGSPDDPFWSGSLKPKVRPKGLGAK